MKNIRNIYNFISRLEAIRINSIILPIVLIFSNISFGQSPLTDVRATPPSKASECIQIYIGNTAYMTNATNCNTPISLVYDNGDMITGIGSIIETTSTFPHTFKFDSLGIYSFLCENKNIADQCFHVIPLPSPTLGQWALINLGLLISIIATLKILGDSTKRDSYQSILSSLDR